MSYREIWYNTENAATLLQSLKESAKTLGYLFYITAPSANSFERVEDVPDYITEVVPFFVIMIILEQVFLYCKGKSLLRINDAFNSAGTGIILELSKLFFRSVFFANYVWFYDHFAIISLPWHSAWTWIAAFVAVDFTFYWFHRATHEVNIFWASHKVHHGPDYNLLLPLRQPVIHAYCSMFFYLPLGFFIPPSFYWVHMQLNTIFQFWIHTEVVGKLGPLEYIFNTPSHHRVHHGKNRYCIDKNYAGTLIIWDRLFGTFEPESEEVVYGSTHDIETFDPFYSQIQYYIYMGRTLLKTKGIGNKISVLLKGPGWEPGKHRLGNIEDVPDVHPQMPKYNPILPLWCNVYVVIHSCCIVAGYMEVILRHLEFSQFVVITSVLYLCLSLTSIGAILDKRCYAAILELFRCLLFFAMDLLIIPVTNGSSPSFLRLTVLWIARLVFGSSAAFWGTMCLKNITVKIYPQKKVD